MTEIRHEPEYGAQPWALYDDGLCYDRYASEEEAEKFKGYMELKNEINEAITEVVGELLEDKDVTDEFITFFEEYTGHDLRDWW